MAEERFLRHPDAGVARAAELYAARGWPVLPLWWPRTSGACACGNPECGNPGKHPLIRRGFHAASTDVATIRRWWARWPAANLGIRTGGASGILVIDVDGERGRESLRTLRREHGPLRAAWVRTGSGGWHAYLRLPPGLHVPCSVGRLGPGLDVRADGGSIVAPPSRHAAGGLYQWRRTPGELPDAPAWVIELAQPPPPPPMRPLTLRGREVTERYAAAAINREAAAVAGAPAGTRNHRLNLAAFRLGRLVGVAWRTRASRRRPCWRPRPPPDWPARRAQSRSEAACAPASSGRDDRNPRRRRQHQIRDRDRPPDSPAAFSHTPSDGSYACHVVGSRD